MLTFKQEFQLKNFRFRYRPVKDFVTSPWFPTPVLIAYRSIFALYSLSWIIYRLAFTESFRKIKTLFYITNWSYFTLIIYFLLSANITILHYIKRRQGQEHELIDSDDDLEKGKPTVQEDETRWFHKLLWYYYELSATMAIGVTLFYYVFDYDGSGVSLSDINVHTLNAVFMIIDHTLSNMPVRIFHMIYPMFFVFMYMIASVLYWAIISKDYIYKAMNYNTNPGLAVGLLITAMIIAAPIIHMFYYATYRLRVFVVGKWMGDDEDDSEQGQEMH